MTLIFFRNLKNIHMRPSQRLRFFGIDCEVFNNLAHLIASLSSTCLEVFMWIALRPSMFKLNVV